MKESMLAAYEKATGYPCPYRELHPLNREAHLIAETLLSPHLKHAADSMIAAATAGMSSDDRMATLQRAFTAIHSKDVLRLLHPPKDTAPAPGRR